MDADGGYVRRQPAAGVGSVDAQHYACERVQELDTPASTGPSGTPASGQDLVRPSQSILKTYSSMMKLGALPVATAGSRLTELESLK